jgi:hypothetical protein
VLCKTETLAYQAPKAISRHRVARGFHRHGESDSSVCESIGFDAKSEEAVVDTPATGIDRIELQLAAQAQFCAKT